MTASWSSSTRSATSPTASSPDPPREWRSVVGSGLTNPTTVRHSRGLLRPCADKALCCRGNMAGMPDDLAEALMTVGPRLRALRQRNEATLAQLSEATGISVSTLSRLESGQRKPTLELLLPLARAHGVTLDE